MADLRFIPVDKCRHCRLFCHMYLHVAQKGGAYTGYCEFYRQIIPDIDSKPIECDVLGYHVKMKETPMIHKQSSFSMGFGHKKG